MDKKVELTMASDDIIWEVQARVADNVLNIEVQGRNTGSDELQVQLCLTGSTERLHDLGELTSKVLAHLDIDPWLSRKRANTYAVEKRGRGWKAYTPWASEDDEALLRQQAEGVSIADLTIEFQRGEGAIRSRLRRLGAIS